MITNLQPAAGFQVILALPAYNEEAAIGQLIESAYEVLTKASLPCRIVVVDDGSKDRTGTILLELAKRFPLTIKKHMVNKNLGPTIRDALRVAAGLASDNDIIITMDADGTHPVSLMPEMVRAVGEGNDVVIGSRFRRDAKVVGVPVERQVFSIGVSLLFRFVYPIKGIRDYTCGYRAYRASVIKRAFASQGDRFIDQVGFQCMVDILLKLSRYKLRFKEVPMVLRYDIKQGESKMKVTKTIFATLRLLLRRRLGF